MKCLDLIVFVVCILFGVFNIMGEEITEAISHRAILAILAYIVIRLD